MSFVADHESVGVRARALSERSRNICVRRLNDAEKALRGDWPCWCKVLREKDTDGELPCPPQYVDPSIAS